MTVLIVDSSIQIIERLKMLLLETGVVTGVYPAVSYAEAIKIFKENKVRQK